MVRMIHAGILVGVLGLAACSSSNDAAGPDTPPPEGRPIRTPNIEHYTTDHNGYSRARINNATGPADDDILAQFDDSNPGNPADYRNLIALTEDRYRDNMQIEVIAEVTMQEGDEQVVRILRLTADQAPFDNIDEAGNTIASGEFFFRGNAEVYASVDGGPLQRGVGGFQDMVVNFDSETMRIDIRTTFNADGGFQTIMATDIPFNVVTGAFGGQVTMTTTIADTGEMIVDTPGTLRGNLSADEETLRNHREDATTSGLFTIGRNNDRVQADGVFWGRHPNTQ